MIFNIRMASLEIDMRNNTNHDDGKLTSVEKFEIISQILLCIIGGIGNILVVLVVCQQNKMRTITNYFIVNLAASDLFVLFINIPLDLIVRLSGGKWLYGAAMCKLIPPLQTMATTVSVWSLVAISVARYIAIVYPLRPQLRTDQAKWIILMVWSIGLVLVIPYMVAQNLRDEHCLEDFEAVGMVTPAYTLGVFIVQYVVPLTIIAICYVRVCRELSQNQLDHENSHLIAEQRKETRKVIKILRVVVAAFAVLVLPIHLLYIWSDFFHGGSSSLFATFGVISLVMLYSNSASNPILYNVCNEQFREGFKLYFKPCLTTLRSGRNCQDEEYLNQTKESDLCSVAYSPTKSSSGIRLSTCSSSSTRGSLGQNGKCTITSLEETNGKNLSSAF